jgi:uncharacterized protein (DUF2236 family)
MADFVDKDSIVRKIWSNPDLVLLIFTGAAAEFALNRAVDWLFFTNRVPNDPVGRLFSTVRYAQEILFVDEARAKRTLDRISAAHRSVELRRGERIPDWAFRDVLYLLIDYSERAHELLFRPLTISERQELYSEFLRLGLGLQIPELPSSYFEWRVDRQLHLMRDLAYSKYTRMLYERYREHLGELRYQLMLELQAILTPVYVRRLLRINSRLPLDVALRVYGLCAVRELRSLVQWLVIPPAYLEEVRQLEYPRAA